MHSLLSFHGILHCPWHRHFQYSCHYFVYPPCILPFKLWPLWDGFVKKKWPCQEDHLNRHRNIQTNFILRPSTWYSWKLVTKSLCNCRLMYDIHTLHAQTNVWRQNHTNAQVWQHGLWHLKTWKPTDTGAHDYTILHGKLKAGTLPLNKLRWLVDDVPFPMLFFPWFLYDGSPFRFCSCFLAEVPATVKAPFSFISHPNLI